MNLTTIAVVTATYGMTLGLSVGMLSIQLLPMLQFFAAYICYFTGKTEDLPAHPADDLAEQSREDDTGHNHMLVTCMMTSLYNSTDTVKCLFCNVCM